MQQIKSWATPTLISRRTKAIRAANKVFGSYNRKRWGTHCARWRYLNVDELQRIQTDVDWIVGWANWK